MKVECFLDTNILLYSVSRSHKHLSKKIKAIELIETTNFGTSAQIAQEFYFNAIRKPDFGMKPEDAMDVIELLEEQPFIATDLTLIKNAIELSVRYHISYWDGAIIAAADALGAPILYTEELNHGQMYGSVNVVNPFIDIHSLTGFHEPAQSPLR